MRTDPRLIRAPSRHPGLLVLAILATVLLTWIGCVDVSTLPSGSGTASLSLAATLPAGASIQANSIDEWRVRVIRPGEGVILEESGAVSAGQDSVSVPPLSVMVLSGCETLTVRVELLSTGEVFYRGERDEYVCAGHQYEILELELEWVGPSPPDIFPERLTFSVDRGESQSQTFTITQTGTRVVDWSVRIEEESVGWLSIEPMNGSVSQAQPQIVQVSVDASGLAVGQYFANLTVEGEGFPFPIKRILVELNVIEPTIPDLVVSSLTHAPTSPTTDDPVTLTAVVRNDGNATATATTLRLEVTGAAATTHDVPQLAPGQTYSVPRPLGTLAAGSYTVTATADDGGTVAESNEANNQRTDNFTVTTAPQPDLVVSSLTHAPASPTTDDPVTLAAVVRNDGNATAGASTLRLEVTGAAATTHDVPQLAPGQTYSVPRPLGTLAAGSYTVTATADDGGTVAESNEANNQRTDNFTVTTAPQPDLVVSSLTHAPASPTTDDP
ncbi:CARDB domain-containing protein, partial [Gemmatimonadota bacterium]